MAIEKRGKTFFFFLDLNRIAIKNILMFKQRFRLGKNTPRLIKHANGSETLTVFSV